MGLQQEQKEPLATSLGRERFLLFLDMPWRMAERVGFEPTRGLTPLRAFQARLFGHSSTSPSAGILSPCRRLKPPPPPSGTSER